MDDPPAPLTTEQIAAAEAVAGLQFTAAERALMLEGLEKHRAAYTTLRTVALPNDVPPALIFDPRAPGTAAAAPGAPAAPAEEQPPTLPVAAPADLEDLAFASIDELAALIRTRQVSARALTEMYIRRLRRYDPLLHCVVTLTEERALAQADQADAELAAGHYRGPLHGIPWGAKDLFATAGIATTWGATPYKDQVFDHDATVVARLDAAGAILVAKLSVGALAWGDVWFGGQTRNPWHPAEGSSGSSAGPGAAVAAGLVGFAVGTETHGSIVSPCTRCGITGLRPTFGRVSRAGAMALAWSLDKIGPMARSAEDCALVFAAIAGPDGQDGTVVERAFAWPPAVDLAGLRIGYVTGGEAAEDAKDAEDLEEAEEADPAQAANNRETLRALRQLGATLVPINLPAYPVAALSFILDAEAAAAFDELTRSNRDELLERQGEDTWPNVFRQARLIPAVEYIQAQRVRSRLIAAMADLLATVDLYVAPSRGGANLLLTNLTGHPAVVLPNGFTAAGRPTSITFTGRLDDEARLLGVAQAYQAATGWHRRHPVLPAPAEST